MSELARVTARELTGFHERIQREATILLYHGVTDVASRGIENRDRKHIATAEFVHQMAFLRREAHPLSIDELLALLVEGRRLPPRAVVVSFDDGFRNNFTQAVPVLEKYSIPAVFYVTSGIVNTDLMFWVDELEDCLNLTRRRSLLVRTDRLMEFDLTTDDARMAALRSIKAYCKIAPADEVERVVQEVAAGTGVEASVAHSPNYEKISWSELREMHRHPLFTIGGHSLYHRILTSLSPEALEREVRASLDLLTVKLGGNIEHYSYPEGQAHHYDGKTIDMLKRFGVRCSPSAIPGLNPPGTSPFHLRRIMVGFQEVPFPYLVPTCSE